MVVKVNDVYKCSICGNIIEVLFAGGGKLVCCGKEMNLLEVNTVDASVEKHKPIIEKTTDGFKVKIGEIDHPMEEKHYIQWVELIADNIVYRHELTYTDLPQASFCVKANNVSARIYCNLHGLWADK